MREPSAILVTQHLPKEIPLAWRDITGAPLARIAIHLGLAGDALTSNAPSRADQGNHERLPAVR